MKLNFEVWLQKKESKTTQFTDNDDFWCIT